MVVQQYGECETGFSKHDCSFLQEMTSFLKAAANLWWDTRSPANTTWTSNQFIQGQIHSRESFRRGRKHGGYLLLEYSCRKSSGKHFGSIAGSIRITTNTHTKSWLVLNKKQKRTFHFTVWYVRNIQDYRSWIYNQVLSKCKTWPRRSRKQHCEQLTQFFWQIACFQSSSGWRVTRGSRDSSWRGSLGILWPQLGRTLQGPLRSSTSIRCRVIQLVPGKEYIHSKYSCCIKANLEGQKAFNDCG